MARRVTAFILTLCLLAATMLPVLPVAATTTVMTGTVKVDDLLRVRNGPGTTYAKIGELFNGDVVTILETVTDAAGIKWYKITKGSMVGYASADYIVLNPTYEYETDEQFEAHLTAQNFPEDYKVLLRQLHAKYPNWLFLADHLTMTWAEAFAAESQIGLNTIRKPDAWKSMEYGAYNWSTGTYEDVDGGYVTALPALVAYYMDPRNFLTESQVFQFEDLNHLTGQTVEGVQNILPSKLDPYAADVLEAANNAGISAYHLASRMTQEGSHTNGLGTGTVEGHEGYYNFFHIGAYAHSGRGAVTNGALYAEKMGWDTPAKCLAYGASFIKNQYVDWGQDNPYYQKFNVISTKYKYYTHQYMSNTSAAESESSIRYSAAKRSDENKAEADKELSKAITFTIPVYKKMPTKVAPKPSETGNNNNFLDSITVSGCSLTPTFNRYTLGYSAAVAEGVTTVDITAVPNSKDAKVTGGGKIQLSPGENEIPITVTSTSGQVRVYTLTITLPGDVVVDKKPQITGKVYTVGETVTKVEPETSITKFIQTLAVTDGTAKVFTPDGKEKTNAYVGTGDILRLYSGNTLYASYPIVIYGDVNGDGKVTSLDLRIIQKHILEMTPLEGYKLVAADANKDGKVVSLDLRIIQKHILGITATLQ